MAANADESVGRAEKQVPEYLDLVEKVNRLEVILKRTTKKQEKEMRLLTEYVHRYNDYGTEVDGCEEEDETVGTTIDPPWPPKVSAHVPRQLNTQAVVRIKPEPLFWLKYNSAKNAYESSCEELHQKKNWSTLIYGSENLELGFVDGRNWTTFVARYEGCSFKQDGVVRWRFDLSSLGDCWQRVEVQANGKLFPGTKISLCALSYDAEQAPLARIELKVNDLNTMTADQLHAGGSVATVIDLVAKLSDSNPKEKFHWQKPQLFRQSIDQRNQENYWPFAFFIY